MRGKARKAPTVAPSRNADPQACLSPQPATGHDDCCDQEARVSPEVRIAIGLLVVFSGGLLLVSAWMLARADADARRYFPLQFTDELSARYYMMYALSNRSIHLEIRRRLA